MTIKAAKQPDNAYAVTNPAITTADATAPTFANATVNGNQLIMTYSEALDAAHQATANAFTVKVGGVANTVTAVAVDAAAKTLTLTLSTAVQSNNKVTVAYTDRSGNNINTVQDASGNDARSFFAHAVINNTPDTRAPVFAHATVNGSTLVMTYSEALDASHAPAAGKFAVAVGGVANVVKAVVVNAVAKTVTLTLATAVSHDAAVTVKYTDPNGNDNINAIQDKAGNDALTLSAHVTNTTPDTTAPVFAHATVNGSTLVMTYGETLDARHAPSAGK
ncbi:MAG: SwmB domain-containing protein, partial [Methylobacter sp.]|nr:SwmB domain-containing protein [Methylobacter sp.]